MTGKERCIKGVKWGAFSLISLVAVITLLVYVFQDRICNAVLNEVGKQFKEPVYFKSADVTFWSTFPNLAINLNEVKINDAFPHEKSDGKLLTAERIRMVFNPWDLWKEDYHIRVVELKNGELNVKISKSGATNYNIIRPSSDTSSNPLAVKISSFRTLNFAVNYLNASDEQNIRTSLEEMTFSGNMNDLKFALNAQGKFHVKEIQSGAVVLVKNKPVEVELSMNIDAETGSITFPKTQILIASIPLSLGGIYTPDSMDISLNAESLPLVEVVNKLSIETAKKELEAYKGRGTVDFNLTLASNKNHPQTQIDCNFKVKNGHLKEPVKNTHISQLSLSGSYHSNGTPQQDRLSLSNVHFVSIAGPFQGNIIVSNFLQPRVKGSVKGGIDLGVVSKIYKNTYLDELNGLAKLNAEFDLQMDNEVTVNKVNGHLNLRNVGFKAKNDHRTFKNINGDFALKGSRVEIQGATLVLNNSDVNLNGSFGNVYNYLSSKGNLMVDGAITSKNIFVEDLGKTTIEEKLDNEGKQFALPRNIEGTISLNAQKISYDNHRFEQIKGHLNIQKGRIHFPSLSLRNGEADIYGNLSIDEDAPEHLLINAQLSTRNLHFAPMFKEWNNFDQEVITAQQISGQALAEINFFAPFNLIGGIDLNQMKVSAHLKVVDGALRNVKALEEVASSLKTNSGKLLIGKRNIDHFERNLRDISFNTLENTFTIQRGVLTIPNMRIESNAMNLELSGTHSFEQQIDYRIKFDFRELLGEDRDADFGTVVDDGTGLKVYLRMYGNLDNPTIEWDKSSRKQDIKQQFTQEKETVKSILKTEFGAFKADTTVKEMKASKQSKEVVKINFNPQKEEKKADDVKDQVKASKDGKIKSKLNQWKQEQNQNNVSVVVKKG
ncbi:MAG: AsmA-like C-terminal region-containing protein [Bacteroidota bacterium]